MQKAAGKTHPPKLSLPKLSFPGTLDAGNTVTTVRRLATPHRKGVALMVTYEGLFAFCMLIVSIIALFQGNKK